MNLSDRIYLSIYLSLYLSTTTALGRFCDQFLNALDGFYKGRSSRRVLPGPLQVTTLVTTFFQRGATLYETTRAAPNLLRLVQEGMSTAASCASGDIYAGGPRPAKRLFLFSFVAKHTLVPLRTNGGPAAPLRAAFGCPQGPVGSL